MKLKSYSLYTIQTGFFHLVICIEVSSMASHGLVAHSFLVLNNSLFSGYSSFFIHSRPEGYLGCFQVLAIMNKAAVNIYVQAFV